MSNVAEVTRPPLREPVEHPRESSRQRDRAAALPAAFRAALSLAHQPSLARKYRREPLPGGILRLIRIAARSKGDRDQATDIIDAELMVSRAVAIFYLENVLWTEPRDPYRVLGLRPGASQDEVTENAHWLMKWLHPYIGEDRREAAFADSVLEAWEALNPEPDDASADPSAETPSVVETGEATHRPKDRSRLGRNPATRRDAPRRRRWRIGLTIVIGGLAVAGAMIGARYLSERGGDIPAVGGIVSGPVVPELSRAQP